MAVSSVKENGVRNISGFLRATGKTENLTEMQRQWRNEFGIWCWWWTFYTYMTLNTKYCNSISIYM
jgi:hypothetical protein